jgi:hypothetical protein
MILQQSQREGDGIELVWARFEHQRQYQKPNENGVAGAFRFDFQFAEGDNAQRPFVRVGWLTYYPLGKHNARLKIFVDTDFGAARRLDVSLPSRGQFTRNIADYMVGLQMFNSYNATDSMGRCNNRCHQVALVSKRFGDWSVFGSYPAGMTSLSPEDAFRLFIKRPL